MRVWRNPYHAQNGSVLQCGLCGKEAALRAALEAAPLLAAASKRAAKMLAQGQQPSPRKRRAGVSDQQAQHEAEAAEAAAVTAAAHSASDSPSSDDDGAEGSEDGEEDMED